MNKPSKAFWRHFTWIFRGMCLSASILLAGSTSISAAAPPAGAGAGSLEILPGDFKPDPAQAPPGGDGLWRDVDKTALQVQGGQRLIIPAKYRAIAADITALDQLLARAPLENSASAQSAGVTLPLPLPDGTFGRFQIEESPLMEPALAARHPEIRTYRGLGLDDTTATARLDRTPAGFHGLILSGAGTIYIDPYRRGDVTHYISYDKRDYRNIWGKTFSEEGLVAANPPGRLRRPLVAAASSGPILRTYRLAMAATGEYTQFHGGTVNEALAAINTTLNRVNGIYEREASIRMILIANTDQLIYIDGTTDPYTNNNGGAMLNQNQNNIDSIIGNANYDIGHVFSTGGGGVAYLYTPCNPGFKARGVTGSSMPVGDPFDVDYVAHEMGHQFGANHTFNAGNAGSCNSGNRNPSTAYEPGSASTIMSYAGICPNQDLQPHSDDYFHTISFDEIIDFVTDTGPGGGATCAGQSATGNSAPNVEAGQNYTIPRQTPFTLTGSATDPQNDSLTFNWEEFDLGPVWTSAGLPNTDSDGQARPIFRSYLPASTPSRTFPALANILDGSYANKGEALPTIARTLSFRLTARDNKGGVNRDSMAVSVANNSGPFRVTSPNSAAIWEPGSQQTITWNVANTTAAPVSCPNVKILLSADGGNTFPITLVSNTANDGSQTITIPNNVAAGAAHVKVKCANNVFFDISKGDLTICSVILKDTHEDGFGDWSIANGAGTNDWQGRTNGGFSGSNYWFVADINSISDSYLESPALTATNDGLSLRFFHKYDLERQNATTGYDGGVVEINVNNGGWVDVGQANFAKNGYNVTINPGFGNPLAGRPAFSGDSGDYIESLVDLSSLVNQGDTFHIRFREANDNALGVDGWSVDDVIICAGPPSESSKIYLPLILSSGAN